MFKVVIKFGELKQIEISVYRDIENEMDNRELLGYRRAIYLFVSLALLSKGEINNMKKKRRYAPIRTI